MCVCLCVKLLQSCQALCDSMNCKPTYGAPLSMGFFREEYWSGLPCPPPGDLPDPGSNSHLLHWQADSLLLGHLGSHRKRCVHVHLQSCSTLCEPPDWSPPGSLSLGFSRQEYWTGLRFPTPGDLPDPEMETASFTSPAWAGKFFNTSATWEDLVIKISIRNLITSFIKWDFNILTSKVITILTEIV